MTRRVLVVLSLAGLAACSGEPSQPSEPAGGPAFAIVDGSDPGGRPDFAWRPPIGNTTIEGSFDGNKHPTVRICVLNVADQACTGADVFTATDVPVVNANYQVDWTVPISPVTHYRIFVQTINPSVILGFADVRTAATSKGLKGNDPNEFVGITDGSILPIKFRITDACEDQDCSGGFIDTNQGGTAYHTDENGETVGGVTIPPDPQGDGRIVTVDFSLCNDLPIDNPKFGSCISVLAQDDDNVEYAGAGVAFVCDAETAVGSLSPAQQELVTLHRKHNTDPVEALPHAADQCPSIITIGSVKGLFRALVQGKWKRAGRQLAALVAPRPLYARRLDAGAGGAILDGGFSDFQFALPATLEISAGDDQVALAGSTLATDPTVLVRDFLGNPVANATVHFSTADGSVTPTSQLTDANGLASADWTLAASATLGQKQLIASGYGLAAANANGPRTGVDPFLPLMNHAPFNDGVAGAAVPLDTGKVFFSATPIEGFETDAGWAASGFWHRSTLAGIINQAFTDGLVTLGAGDASAGAMPSPFAGSFAFWYGTEPGAGVGSENGNYIGTRSGNNATGSLSGGESTTANSGVLSSTAFVVPADGMLRFETWWEIESFDPNAFDLMTVLVEEVGVGTTAVGSLNPITDPDGAPSQPFTTNGFNVAPAWAGFGVSLGAYAGKTVKLHFDFNTGDANYNGFRGWLLDNVRVVPEPVIIGLRSLTAAARTLNPPRAVGTRAP